MDDPELLSQILDFARGLFGDLVANIMLGVLALAIVVFALWVIFHYLGAITAKPINAIASLVRRLRTKGRLGVEPVTQPSTEKDNIADNRGIVVTGDHAVLQGTFSVGSGGRVHVGEVLKPYLRVEQGKEESTGTISRGWGLIVWADAESDALGIHAKLEAMTSEYVIESVPLDGWPTDRDLHWAGQIDDFDTKIPAGQSARLNVFYYDRTTKKVKLSYHRATEEFREQNSLLINLPLLILINIASEGRQPTFVVCRLDPKSASNLIYQGYANEAPFTLLWHGPERRQLSEFQQESS